MERTWNRVFVDGYFGLARRQKPYKRKPDGTQDAGHKDEND